jgi:hypothetical protein
LRVKDFVPSPAMQQALDIRRGVLWPLLADTPSANRRATLSNAVKTNRASIAAEVQGRAALLLPELVDAQPGTRVRVPVTLEGAFSLASLQARVALSNGLQFAGAQASATLRDGGYQLLADNNMGVFQIQLRPGAAKPAALPTGQLLDLELIVDPTALGICTVGLEVLATDASQPYWAGHNAVIVQT